MDEWSPRTADVSRDYEVFPQVDQECAIDIGEKIGGFAFAQDDLIDPCSVTAIT
jgi:hypothetical protein